MGQQGNRSLSETERTGVGAKNSIGRGKERYKKEGKTRRSPAAKMLSTTLLSKGSETALCRTVIGIPEIGRANSHGLGGVEKGFGQD